MCVFEKIISNLIYEIFYKRRKPEAYFYNEVTVLQGPVLECALDTINTQIPWYSFVPVVKYRGGHI